MKFEDPMAAAYAKNDGMDEVIEDNTEETVEDNEETETDDNPNSLGEAYARDRNEKLTTEETVEDNEETETETETDDNPNSLGEAYARDRKEVGEDSEAVDTKTENIVENTGVGDVENEETQSFTEIGEEKWVEVSGKISTFSEDLVDKGKNAVYTATGLLIEAPNIAKGVGVVVGEMADKAYETAYKTYYNTVEAVNNKVQEIKDNLADRAKEAKKNFFDKITRTKDKYIGKAAELTAKGIELGINVGAQVAVKIEETHKELTNAINVARVEALNAQIESSKKKKKKHTVKAEKHAEKEIERKSKLGELYKNIVGESEEKRHGAKSMKSILENIADVSI